MSQADTVNCVPCSIDKDMIIESINKLKNGKALGPSGIVSEMLNAAGEAVELTTVLVNQATVERVISAECKLLIGKRRCFRKRKLWLTEINRPDSGER